MSGTTLRAFHASHVAHLLPTALWAGVPPSSPSCTVGKRMIMCLKSQLRPGGLKRSVSPGADRGAQASLIELRRGVHCPSVAAGALEPQRGRRMSPGRKPQEAMTPCRVETDVSYGAPNVSATAFR